MTNLFKLPTVNLNNWVIKQTGSTEFSPGTSAVLQMQITAAETTRVTRPLSCFSIRPLTPEENKPKKPRIKVGGTGVSRDYSFPLRKIPILMHVSTAKQAFHLHDDYWNPRDPHISTARQVLVEHCSMLRN